MTIGPKNVFSGPTIPLSVLMATLTSLPLSAVGVPRPDHVVVVMEENHGYSEVIGASVAPYINSLAQAGALFTDSHAIEHPSEPNYLDLFSGSNQGVTDDSCPHTFSKTNLGEALIRAGFTFGGYSEDMPSVGYTGCSSAKFVRRHSPWINFTNVPATASMPFTSWPSDFRNLPTLSFLVPNLNHDMHNGTITQADTWLQIHLESYRQWAMSHNSLLIVTWDEDDRKAGNHIATIFIGPMVRPGRYGETINHFNVLRTLEDMYDLPLAGKSASAPPVPDVWTTSVQGPDCNHNGVPDAVDIANETSKDDNKDAIPDECQTIQGQIELVQADPGCVLLVLESDVTIKGGELGLAYDPQAVVPMSVTPAADLPSGAEIHFDPRPYNNCPPEQGVAAGFTLGWTNSITGDIVTAPGRHALLKICFALPPGAYRGASYPLKFINCLGLPESPVRNVIRDSSGKPLFVPTRDGEVSIPGRTSFRRGDVDGDATIDLTDALAVLGWLFLGGDALTCEAAADASDDGEVNLSDPIAVLNMLFLGAGPLPPPGPQTCGPDPTPDQLGCTTNC